MFCIIFDDILQVGVVRGVMRVPPGHDGSALGHSCHACCKLCQKVDFLCLQQYFEKGNMFYIIFDNIVQVGVVRGVMRVPPGHDRSALGHSCHACCKLCQKVDFLCLQRYFEKGNMFYIIFDNIVQVGVVRGVMRVPPGHHHSCTNVWAHQNGTLNSKNWFKYENY